MIDEVREGFEAVDSLLDNCDVDVQHTTNDARSEVSDAQALAEYEDRCEGSEVGADPY
jgi:hypothetical protein